MGFTTSIVGTGKIFSPKMSAEPEKVLFFFAHLCYNGKKCGINIGKKYRKKRTSLRSFHGKRYKTSQFSSASVFEIIPVSISEAELFSIEEYGRYVNGETGKILGHGPREFQSSGLNKAEFCRQNELKTSTLNY